MSTVPITPNREPPSETPLDRAGPGVRHVFVRNLVLDALVGVHRHEKKRRQPIRVNVDLAVRDAPAADRLDDVVCYEDVVNRIKGLIAEGHVNLVETLAERVAQDCLVDRRVLAVRIRVEKLGVIPEAESVGIEIERRRSGLETR